MKKVIWMLGLLTVFTLSSCGSVTITLPNTTPTTGNNPTGGEPHWGVQTKTSGCRANGGLSDSACTPGAILATATKEAICQSGYASTVRNVPTSVKNQVYAEYDIRSHAPGQYEVDHLVSLELGGSNELSNLWPELASPQPGFHEKDSVENDLHSQVCSGAMALKEAQIEIATNWLAVYQKMPHSQRSSGQCHLNKKNVPEALLFESKALLSRSLAMEREVGALDDARVKAEATRGQQGGRLS